MHAFYKIIKTTKWKLHSSPYSSKLAWGGKDSLDQPDSHSMKKCILLINFFPPFKHAYISALKTWDDKEHCFHVMSFQVFQSHLAIIAASCILPWCLQHTNLYTPTDCRAEQPSAPILRVFVLRDLPYMKRISVKVTEILLCKEF